MYLFYERFMPFFLLVVAAKLGANAILGVSLAMCKAGAAEKVQFCKCNILVDELRKRWHHFRLLFQMIHEGNYLSRCISYTFGFQ